MDESVRFGCCIRSGPQDWQIFQREADGFATVALAGTWKLPDPPLVAPAAVVRVVSEETQSAVSRALDWQRAETRADGTWSATLRVPAGGLYRIETGVDFDGRIEWPFRGDAVHHLGVGDLWVIAGQSNAAGYGRGEIFDPPEIGVHVLRNDERWSIATHPLNDQRNNRHANAENHTCGHSPFLTFGKVLRRELGVPIGLIQTALGGSPFSMWNPVENPDAPLYKNLLHCVGLAGKRVAGMVWYQGESNSGPAEDSGTYLARFGDFVGLLRAELGEIPILTAQLNRHLFSEADDVAHRGWSVVAEAQRQAARTLSKVAVIGTLDLPLSDEIHNSPSANLVLGERYARAALGLVHGRDIAWQFPEIASAQFQENRATVLMRFENVTHRLHADGGRITQFSVEDKTGFVPVVKGEVCSKDQIRLTLARPAGDGAVVHNAFGRNPPNEVYDVERTVPLLRFYGVPIS